MTRYSAVYLLVIHWLLMIAPVLSQQRYSPTVDSATRIPIKHGMLENHIFILNGGIIEQHELANYPTARLDRILPYKVSTKHKYQGVVYFHTSWYPPSPPDRYAEDPAFFINGIQVNPYAIRSSRVELYNHIQKSLQDTIIDGILYRGAIYVDTEENFFADRIALPKLVEKYTGLSLEQVIVHWHDGRVDASNPGVMIHDHFNLYYINPKNLEALEIDSIRYAEGERYIINIKDNDFQFYDLRENGWKIPNRTYLVFNNPTELDPSGPCYLANFDTTDNVIHHHAKIEPRPYLGEIAYLKKLSTILGLQTDTSKIAATQDSITVQFMVLENGQMTALWPTMPDKPGHKQILDAIKKHSCVWSVAFGNKGQLLFKRKITISYSRDSKGNIRSLNSLEYRYDDAKS